MQSLRERDVLAVTALDQQAFNQSLLADSPYRPVDNVLSVREPDLWQKVQRRLTGDWTSASLDADRYFSSSSAWRGFISYRSPWNSTRLVVVALASNDDQLARLKTDLESPRINAGIRGDTAVITSDNGVRSFGEYAVPQRSDAVVHDGGLVCQPALRFPGGAGADCHLDNGTGADRDV